MDIKVPGPAAQNVPATRQPAAAHRTSRPSSSRPVSPRHQLCGLQVGFEVSMEDALAMRVEAPPPLTSPSLSSGSLEPTTSKCQFCRVPTALEAFAFLLTTFSKQTPPSPHIQQTSEHCDNPDGWRAGRIS